jgi:hypothetical protein
MRNTGKMLATLLCTTLLLLGLSLLTACEEGQMSAAPGAELKACASCADCPDCGCSCETPCADCHCACDGMPDCCGDGESCCIEDADDCGTAKDSCDRDEPADCGSDKKDDCCGTCGGR